MAARPSRELTQQGVALVVVLWLLMLLGVIAASFAKTMHVESSLAQHSVASARAKAAAEAAIYSGMLEILRPPGLEKQNMKKRFDGRRYRWRFAGVKVWYRIQDETGRIDLNEVQPDILERVLKGAGVSDKDRPALIGAIVDWRDEDKTQSVNGAEDTDYLAAGKTYGAKDGPFNTVEELQRVLGMRPAVYRKLEPLFTVYSHSPQVNQMSAPASVRRALGMMKSPNNQSLNNDAEHGTPPNQDGDPNGEEFDNNDASGLSGGGNLIYTLQAQGEVDGVRGPILTATVRMQQAGNQPYSILAWREGGSELAKEEQR